MPESQKKFNPSPKRFHPKGLTIIYEDHDILVVDKVSGLLTVSTERVREKTAFHLLNNYVQKGNPKSKKKIFIVHRLDRDTSGILVFAKSEKAKDYLQEEWQGFKKIYYAVVEGSLLEKEGIFSSYLAENSALKMYSVNDPAKGKLAKTGYKVLKESKKYSLLEIDLITGRKNQIRAHLSEKGCPVAGDKKYGAKVKGSKRLALHAASITLLHPYTKEKMIFAAKLPAYFNLFF
jgi:tRNA pseudouridine32 synthase/23S rRNA pseudouridine746 synthase/23S rRNA pseudouridine1911/1915/1917 synthase